jgi:hypothetical protein
MEKEVVEEVRQSKIKEGKKNGLERWQISQVVVGHAAQRNIGK